jgi:hypothetical protein
MITKAAALQSPDCGWTGCGQPGPVEVLVTIQGEPAGFACPVGCYCVGHAVITGIDAQTVHDGRLWYRPARPQARHYTQAAAN